MTNDDVVSKIIALLKARRDSLKANRVTDDQCEGDEYRIHELNLMIHEISNPHNWKE